MVAYTADIYTADIYTADIYTADIYTADIYSHYALVNCIHGPRGPGTCRELAGNVTFESVTLTC